MSDNWNLSGEQVTGFVLRLDSQVALLKVAVEEVRQAAHSPSGLERATRALLTEGGAIDFPAVPKVLTRLSRNRQMGALLTDADGEILLANKSFYDLTGYQTASGELELYAEQRGVTGVRTGMVRYQQLPWQTVLSNSDFLTQRLALSDGMRGERLRWLQFCCQPLLAHDGALEGVLTIVAEASEEVEIEDRLNSVIGLLAQQVEDIGNPARRLNALMDRVRRLDDFLPKGHVLSIETAAVEDSVSEDELLYRQLLDLGQPSIEPVAEDLSPETASAIQAFEDSFNIDLGDAKGQEKSLNVDSINNVEALFQEPLTEEPHEIISQPASVVESQLADELDIVATYLPHDEPETELWSEFSDFAIEGIPAAAKDDEPVISVVAPVEAISPPIEEAPVEEDLIEKELIAEEPIEPAAELISEVSELNVEPESEILETQELTVTLLESSAATTIVRASAGKCALVVDDIPVNQKLLVLQLKRLGFVTEIANNGLEALNRLSKFDYDIVFMDCDMPVMDGYDATVAIRKLESESGRHIPIVAMTSYDRDADKERCLACGMDDYLTKGVNASSLSRVIEKVCEQNQSQEYEQLQSETEPFDATTMAANYTQEELNEVVRLFMTSMEAFVNSMQKAIDSRDGALVSQLANSIKGPSATLGLQLITKVSNDILTFSEAQDWPQVRLKYLKLKTVYLRSQEQLRKLCPDVFAEGAHLFG